VRVVEAKQRINWGCKAQFIKLCLVNGEPLIPVRMLLVHENGVHYAVRAGVWKRVQEDGVDE
jgi:hypothetical protein